MDYQIQDFEQRLKHLAACEERLRKSERDPEARRDAGYAALHVARLAAAQHFQATHLGVQDIAPELKAARQALDQSHDSLKGLLRQVLSDESVAYLDPLRELALALRGSGQARAIGVAATSACVALLGLHEEYGGVFGAWQMQVLGFDDMTWMEHVHFNEQIAAHAEALEAARSHLAAQRYGLPSLLYLRAGTQANILKAYLRESVTARDQAARIDALEKGERGLALLERMVGGEGEVHDALQMETKYAMLAGCASVLRRAELAEQFWRGKRQLEVENLLTRLRSVEPCVELVAAVEESARLALTRDWVLRDSGRGRGGGES